MNNELLLLLKKLTDTLIEQTKAKTQVTLEYIMNQQLQTFRLFHQLIYLKKVNGY